MFKGKTKNGVDIKETILMPPPRAAQGDAFWIVVADGSTVRIFGKEKPATAAVHRQTILNPGAPFPERVPVESTRLVQETATLLGKNALAGEFESLVVIAEPVLLGQLRQVLEGWVSEKIKQEYPLNLSWMNESEVIQKIDELDYFAVKKGAA